MGSDRDCVLYCDGQSDSQHVSLPTQKQQPTKRHALAGGLVMNTLVDWLCTRWWISYVHAGGLLCARWWIGYAHAGG